MLESAAKQGVSSKPEIPPLMEWGVSLHNGLMSPIQGGGWCEKFAVDEVVAQLRAEVERLKEELKEVGEANAAFCNESSQLRAELSRMKQEHDVTLSALTLCGAEAVNLVTSAILASRSQGAKEPK